MSDPDIVKQAWQASVAEPTLPDLAAVHSGADRLCRGIRRRNAFEYGACVVVVIGFSAYALFLPSVIMRIGALMVVLGSLIVAWQLHRRASAVAPPERAAAEPILIHQRAQLVRQRDAAADIFTWYLLPLIPGLLVMKLGPALAHGVTGLTHAPRPVWIWLMFAAATGAGIWLLNRRGAVRLQKQIDDIDALIGDKK